MTTAVRLLSFLVALAALGAQNRPAVQLTLLSAELAEGNALRVSVKAAGLSGQRVVLVEGATLLAGGELNLIGEAELVVRNLAPGQRRIMARLPQRMDLRSDVVTVQVTGEELPPATATDFWMAASGEQGRRHVQVVEGRLVVNEQRLEIDGALAAAAVDADLDGRMDLMVATREELLLLVARLDGTYDPAVRLARWPESVPAITNLLPGDWNGDGRWGVLLGTDTGVELWVAGRESGLVRKFRETAYRQPVEADVNGDGMPDLLVEKTAADGKTEPWVWIGTGAGRFVPVKRQPPEARAADALLVSVKGLVEKAASAAGGVPRLSAGQWREGVIAAGDRHSLRLKSDGTVWAWGSNGDGQLGIGTLGSQLLPVPVSGLTGVVAIAAGAYHSLALKSDGKVWAWGLSNSGQIGDGLATQHLTPVQVSGLTGVVAIAGGGLHSLALKSDGTVWAWGYNYYGQLGDLTTTQRLTPVQVSGLTGVVAIAGGWNHSMALKSDGTVWTWGWNIYGLLGDGYTHGTTGDQQRLTPGPVVGLTGVVAIAGAYYHSMALKSDGTVWAWGEDYYGQLGDGTGGSGLGGTTLDSPTPLQVSGLTGVVAIATRGLHSMALKSDGTVWAWGDNRSGALGDGSVAQRLTPVRASGLTGVVAIAGGLYFSLAVKSDGTFWAWGQNYFGALGDGSTMDRWTPVQASGLAGVGLTAIAVGAQHSLALKSNGTVWAWGENDFGQLGDGTTTNRTTPVAVSGLAGVVAIAAGDKFSLALKSDGTVWAWGTDVEGQLGDGTTTLQRLTPVPVSGLAGVVAIAGCHESGLALKSDGTVWAWGYPILGDGTLSQSPTPVPVSVLTGVAAIACGWEVSLALKSDGTVWGWGWNDKGELGDGTTTMRLTPIPVSGFTGVVAIAGGENDSLALKSDGTVWGLGRDDWSQLGDGVITGAGMVNRPTPVQASGLTGVVAISAGYLHSLALKSDGTVWKWGSDSFGGNVVQNITPVQVSGLTGMVAVAGGEWHSLALKSDGTVWAWGRNVEGELGDGSTTNRLTPALVTGLIPSLSIAKSHTGNFTRGQIGATYNVTVSNATGAGPTSGTVTVTETAPSGMTLVSMAGTGWTCAAGGTTCTRSDALNGGASHPAITVTVNVASNAGTPLSNAVSVSGGGSASANTTDATIINAPQPFKIGTYSTGLWQLDVNGNGTLDSGTDKSFFLGWAGATMVTGDWNGDGKTKVGVYSNGYWFLDYDGNGVWDGGVADKLVAWGWPGATPIVGDWNGDGKTKIGVYSNGFWFLDYNGDFLWDGGVVDKQVGWGWAGVTPIVGDWNGNGKTKIGVYVNGFWFLDYNGDYVWDGGVVDKQVGWGWAGVTPIVGDWNGDGKTKIGVYSGGYWYLDYDGNYLWEYPAHDKIWALGWAGTTPVIGDWNGDGKSKAGAFINGYWYLDYNGNGVFDGAGTDRIFAFGAAGDTPVVGRW